jgi:hypothetical protein
MVKFWTVFGAVILVDHNSMESPSVSFSLEIGESSEPTKIEALNNMKNIRKICELLFLKVIGNVLILL